MARRLARRRRAAPNPDSLEAIEEASDSAFAGCSNVTKEQLKKHNAATKKEIPICFWGCALITDPPGGVKIDVSTGN